MLKITLIFVKIYKTTKLSSILQMDWPQHLHLPTYETVRFYLQFGEYTQGGKGFA